MADGGASIYLYAAMAAMAAGSAIVSANAQTDSYNAQARMQEHEADLQVENAKIAWQQAGSREDMARQRARKIMAINRANLAQSGIDASSGSAALLQEQTHDDLEVDALMARYEGSLNARGLTAQSGLTRMGASASRMNAGNARAAGYVSATGQLMQGAAGAYGASTRVKPPSTTLGGGG
jgi:hypothetical protein